MKTKDSYVYREGTTPNTLASISSKNKVYSYPHGNTGFHQIGVMSTFNQTQSRDVQEVRGIGYGDQVAELVPGVMASITLDVTRTAIYFAMLQQVFGYAANADGLVRALKHHQWPFDIKQEIVFSELATRYADKVKMDGIRDNVQAAGPNGYGVSYKGVLIFFEACWMNNWSSELSAETTLINEACNITVSDILDGLSEYGEFIKGGDNPFVEQGSIRFQDGLGTGAPGGL